MSKNKNSKREFLKKVVYIAPVIASFKVTPALAAIGSVSHHRRKGNNGVGNGCDPQPPGNPPVNDECGTTGPGNPGNRHKFFAKKDRFFGGEKHKK